MPFAVALAVLFVLVTPGALHAQPRPGQIRGTVGVGVTRWSASRRVFIATEVRIGFEPNYRLSLAIGFAPR